MQYEFTTVGALIGMVIAILCIIKKVQPALSYKSLEKKEP